MSRSGSRLAARGALVLAAVGVALVLLGRSAPRYTVTAEFTDVRGLVSGAQVRLAGVTVGEVGRIWLGRDDWPRAELSIDDAVSIRATGTAAVRLASLSGEFNRYVSIVQGSGPALARGGLIPRSRRTSPVEVDDAVGTFGPATRRALSAALRGMRTTVTGEGPALAATLKDAQAALTEVTGLSNQIEGDGADLGTLLASAHILAASLAARTPELDGAVAGSATLLRTLAGESTSLAASVAGLPQGLDAAGTALGSVRALAGPANRLLGTVAPAVAELPATANELRGALSVSRPTLQRAATLATLAPGAAHELAPLLRATGPLLAVMTPVLHGLGPMLDQLRVRLPDAFSFFSNWADFTSNYDGNGHAARVGIVLPPAPTSLLSPSSDGPGQLAPPYLRVPGSLEGQPWTDYFKSFVAGGRAAAAKARRR